jgi:Zn-dependent protease with chaperone function
MGLQIVENGIVVQTWPYGAIRRVEGPPGRLRLRCVDGLPLARLEVGDAATAQALVSRCPTLDADRGGSGHTGRIVFWSLAAICSIVAVIYFGIPLFADRLAPMVPASVEKRIGEAVDARVRALFGGKVCANAAGQAAFASLVDKLKRAGAVEMPLDAAVLSASVPNAFALPGGKIYLLDGLLQKAQSVDEVAGVIAHELGHVHHRDNLRKLIQTGGTSFLVGLLFGDVFGGGAVVFAARSLLDASYSRQAEQSADDFAVEVMRKLGRSPKPMGELLTRITGTHAKVNLTILASHPMTEDRMAAMQKADRPNSGPDLLSAQEWSALRSICSARAAPVSAPAPARASAPAPARPSPVGAGGIESSPDSPAQPAPPPQKEPASGGGEGG